jgi:ribose transport system substrate-binding protein
MTSIRTLLPCLAAAALMGAGGCGQPASTGGAPAPAAKKKVKLAFVTNNAANFWTIARRGCEEAQKELGNVGVDFRIPSGGSAAEQQQIVDDLLAKGVDGIAISPVDPDNQTEMLNRVAQQALLITQDSDAPKSKRVCYLGTDNVAAGVQAGEMVKEAIPQGGKIMVFVGKRDAQNARERFAGIQKALAGSNVQIVDIRTDDTDTVRAKSNVKDALVNNPDLACLVGLWNYNGPAIANAVKDAGVQGKVKIVCFDEEEETLTGVAEGLIHATVVQQPFEFGKQSIRAMAAYLGGDKAVFPSDGRLIIPTKVIKKDNVAEFSARLKALLGK